MTTSLEEGFGAAQKPGFFEKPGFYLWRQHRRDWRSPRLMMGYTPHHICSCDMIAHRRCIVIKTLRGWVGLGRDLGWDEQQDWALMMPVVVVLCSTHSLPAG